MPDRKGLVELFPKGCNIPIDLEVWPLDLGYDAGACIHVYMSGGNEIHETKIASATKQVERKGQDCGCIAGS
jgi:hypothetical protein